ncbi:hypothetical protein Tco_0365031 [Tanacetum coccineum]
MASQDARLSKFEADFKQQQSEMTTDRLARSLPSEIVKNPKLNTSPVLSARSYPTKDPQGSTQIYSLINLITICPKQPNEPQNDESEGEDREERSNPENIDAIPHSPHDPSISFIMEKVRKLNSFLESFGWVPQSSDTEIVYTKGDDGEVMFIEIIRKNDDSRKEGLDEEGSTTTEGVEVEYFDTFPTRSELAYHSAIQPRSNLEKEHTKSVYLRNEEDKKRGVEYVMSKILGFYKECLELGPKYATGMDDEGEVT